MKHKYIRPLLNQIQEWADQSFMREICGFVGYDPTTETYILQLEQNDAANPEKFFSIDAFNYLEFCEQYKMLAVFHSHIVGDEKPSVFDIKMAANATTPFLIYSIDSKKFNIYCPPNHEIDVNILDKLKEKVND